MNTVQKCLLVAGLSSALSGVGHTQWVKVNAGLSNTYVQALLVDGSDLYAASYKSSLGAMVFRSTNDGATWTGSSVGLPSRPIFSNAFVALDSCLFLGFYWAGGGVWRSNDCGASWVSASNGLASAAQGRTEVYSLAAGGANLFAGAVGGVFLSTNFGMNWIPVNNGLPIANPGTTDITVYSLTIQAANHLAGTSFRGIYRSTDSGTSWSGTTSGVASHSITEITPFGTDLIAAVWDSGAFLSTDGGANWSAANKGIATAEIWSLVVNGTNIFAGTAGGGVLLSTNRGESWTDVSDGLTDGLVQSLVIKGEYLFAGTINGGGVWRRPLREMTTAVPSLTDGVPSVLQLSQNYPNPFNPSTTIRYGLPERSQVTLAVFNTLGQLVALLVNGEVDAGYHNVAFDASNLPSGVYYYRLQAENYTEVKKLLVMK